MPDLVDLAATFANDTPNHVVGDVDLLCLELLRWIMRVMRGVRVARVVWYIRGTSSGARRTSVSWAVGGVKRWHTFLCFEEDIPNVVGCDVDGVGNTSYAKDALKRSDQTRVFKGCKVVRPL